MYKVDHLYQTAVDNHIQAHIFGLSSNFNASYFSNTGYFPLVNAFKHTHVVYCYLYIQLSLHCKFYSYSETCTMLDIEREREKKSFAAYFNLNAWQTSTSLTSNIEQNHFSSSVAFESYFESFSLTRFHTLSIYHLSFATSLIIVSYFTTFYTHKKLAHHHFRY